MTPIPGVAIMLVLLLCACTHAESPAACGGRDSLLEAVFRFQFDNNLSSLQGRAAVNFIGLEADRDPAPALLARFAGHEPPVKAISSAGYDDRGRVVDPVSGMPALIFRIRRIEQSSPVKATLEGGYFETGISASWTRMRAECRGQAWQIEIIGLRKIS